MKIFPTIVKRVTTVVSGGAVSSRVTVKPALALSQRIVVRVANILPALAVSVRTALRIPVKPALVVTQRASGTPRVDTKPALAVSQRPSTLRFPIFPALAVSVRTALRVPVKPALLVTQRASGTPRVDTKPALMLRPRARLAFAPTKEAIDLVQIKYDLTQTKGANAQTGTGAAWTNPANATGKKNSSNATIAGSALAVDGTLTLDYADSVAKTALTISSVTLKFYVSHTTTLAAASLILSWNKGGADTTLQTITVTTDALAAGLSFDITASITGWADIDALQTKVRFNAGAAAATSNAALDAVELVVVASVTDAI